MTYDEMEKKLIEQDAALKKTQLAVILLAETVKEVVRITQCMPKYANLDQILKERLDDVYRKAGKAKDWMPNESLLY